MQPTGYAPPAQRAVEARIFGTAGWIRGAFLVPPLRIFSDYVNQPHDFMKLKDVILPGVEKTIPFLALQRDSIVMIVPTGDTLQGPEMRELRGADVSCAFAGGVVSGTLRLAQGVRVSDFLLQKTLFFPLHNASAFLRVGGQTEALRDLALVLVNSRRIVGVTEPRFI